MPEKPQFPNLPETEIPDPETLAAQWQYAKAMYSRYYSYAWGTALMAGAGFWALGWYIKGENPFQAKKSE
jgi:hypothetical protein